MAHCVSVSMSVSCVRLLCVYRCVCVCVSYHSTQVKDVIVVHMGIDFNNFTNGLNPTPMAQVYNRTTGVRYTHIHTRTHSHTLCTYAHTLYTMHIRTHYYTHTMYTLCTHTMHVHRHTMHIHRHTMHTQHKYAHTMRTHTLCTYTHAAALTRFASYGRIIRCPCRGGAPTLPYGAIRSSLSGM